MPQIRPNHLHATKQIALIAFEGVEILDVAGPASVFSKANEIRNNTYMITILAEKLSPIKTNSGIFIEPHGVWSCDDPKDIDTLIVAGSYPDIAIKELIREDLITWIKHATMTANRIVSICTGALALGEANLLDGKFCTTHWEFWDYLQARYPRAKVLKSQIFVRDGNLWSSGGITTGIDLALSIVAEDLGKQCAVDIAQTLVLPGIRLGSTPQISALLKKQNQPNRRLSDLLPWIQQNITNDLSAESLAKQSGMSLRNFNRLFSQEFGVTPHSYVLQVRTKYAALLLIETNWTIEDIARKSGFSSIDSLQRGFLKRWNISPTEYRQNGKPVF